MQKFLPGIVAGSFFVIIIIFIFKLLKNTFKHTKFKDDQYSKRIRRFRCLDGHLVRSKGELIIDNYLTFLGFKHIYEKTLKIKGKSVKTDFFLPEYEIYIEYWGLSNKEYVKRKKEKIKLYKKADKKLISIENYMFADIYSKLEDFLNKLLKSKDNKRIVIQKYCNYCGMELDDRFNLL